MDWHQVDTIVGLLDNQCEPDQRCDISPTKHSQRTYIVLLKPNIWWLHLVVSLTNSSHAMSYEPAMIILFRRWNHRKHLHVLWQPSNQPCQLKLVQSWVIYFGTEGVDSKQQFAPFNLERKDTYLTFSNPWCLHKVWPISCYPFIGWTCSLAHPHASLVHMIIMFRGSVRKQD